MSRDSSAACRRCRREGEKLFLKGERCYSSKCAVERRAGTVPGQHARGRQSFSDYKVRLREKQKTKRIFGLAERQFRKYYLDASTTRGVTGSQMLLSLESRLDNVVYRLGFGLSRRMSRQLVGHGHIKVNGRRVDRPGYTVAVNDVIEVSDEAKTNVNIVAGMQSASGRIIPEWLVLEKDSVRGTMKSVPTRQQMIQGVNEQLIVELYSK